MNYAVFDSARGLLFLTDTNRVYVFQPLESGGSTFLGLLAPAESAPGFTFLGGTCSFGLGSNVGNGMALDSEGGFYIADTCAHRVHKFAASGFDGEGKFVPGEYFGWAGRCTTSTNNACDEDRDRSKGYSCDGTFSGEAAFTDDGSGDQLSFVLGTMDKPRAVSVNSSQFFIVDRDTSFMHIFGTLPFKDVTEDSATVTYVSNFDFHSDTDQFTFRVSDGLDDSNIATVDVDVNRNFRPPVALPAAWSVVEDMRSTQILEGDDPDGILGKDFNGLDSLTFEIVSWPEFGWLVPLDGLDSDTWRYIPKPNYYGPDSLEFRVSDGLFTSEPARVDIDVQPVNDRPFVTLNELPRAGRGFPFNLGSTFTDDPSEGYTATLEWGDGATDQEAELIYDEVEEEFVLDGVHIRGPMGNQAGATTALHTYELSGPQTLELCVTDSGGLGHCRSAEILVEEVVAFSLLGEAAPIEGNAGQPFRFTLEIENRIPKWVGIGQIGLDALNVVMTAKLDANLDLQSFATTVGTCEEETEGQVRCSLGDMSPGAVVEVTLETLSNANIVYDALAQVEFSVTTDTVSLETSFDTLVDVELFADQSDFDGDGMTDNFELINGLNASVDDSAGDPDGDGLSNLREFENGSSPNDEDSDDDGLLDGEEVDDHGTDPSNMDSDGDGINDGDEVNIYFTLPSDGDTDNDGMDDGWEIRFELDPLSAEPGKDTDNDGVEDLTEYQSFTDPRDRYSLPGMIFYGNFEDQE
jgi:hypothetical protein